ncbi:beta-lactamase family protein [uncultured Psychroserpens sp.]|uniref:beta-lactamase family protein n=1 Tax=uncultured Psychroserpens sp. TaxID=255436 RepID=UPI0026047DB1|nr:beta-lactamase family protein [uncultured Psychroserpens sp.]
MNKKIVCIISLLIVILSCKNSEPEKLVERTIENSLLSKYSNSFDSLSFMSLEARMNYYKVPGLSLSIIENDDIIQSNFYGYRDLNLKFRGNVNTMFQSASTGKSLTATLVMQLVNEGLLDLDTDINQYLKTWRIPENEYNKNEIITLRMLLSHTSGLSTHGFDGYKKTDSLPNIYQILNGKPPANSSKVVSKRKPQTKWEYSGGGYQVIQLIIEDITGKPFVDVVTEKLIKPLKLTNTVWQTQLESKYHLKVSKEYHKGNEMLEGGWFNLASNGAGGGLWTTPKDLAKFIITLNKSRFKPTAISLSQEQAKEMQTKQTTNKAFGLGLFLDINDEYTAIYHPGGNMGYRTMMYYIPQTKQGIVIMANSDNAWYLIPEIMRAASYVYNWPLYKTEIKEETITSKHINEFLKDNNLKNLKSKLSAYSKNKTYKEVIYNELSDFGASQYQIWRMKEAISLFKMNNELFQDSLDTYINLGMAYRRNENYELAKEVFERGMEIDSTDEFLIEKINEMDKKIIH